VTGRLATTAANAMLDSALHYMQVMGSTLEGTVEQRLGSILGDSVQPRGQALAL